MANEIASALFEDVGESFAGGTALGTGQALGKVTQEALTEEFSVSPYRIYMASFMGGDIGRLGGGLTKGRASLSALGDEIKDLQGQIKEAKRMGVREGVDIKTKEVKEGFEFKNTKEAIDALAKAMGKSADYKVEKTADGLTALRSFYVKNGGGQDMNSFLNALQKAGIDTEEQAQAKAESITKDIDAKAVEEEKIISKTGTINDLIKAFNKKVDEFDKAKKNVRKLQKDFNKFVPKKTELEKIVGLKQNMDIATLRRLFSGGSQSEGIEKRRIHRDFITNIRAMKKDIGQAPIFVKGEEGKLIKTGSKLDAILNKLEADASEILSKRRNFASSAEFADGLYDSLSRVSNISSERVREGKNIKNLLEELRIIGGQPVIVISPDDAKDFGFRTGAPAVVPEKTVTPQAPTVSLRTRN